MSARRVLLAGLAIAALSPLFMAQSASAGTWLEMNWYLSGPRYDGVLPP